MKEYITFEGLQEQYGLPNIILYAAPVMFALVFLEMYISHRKKKDLYTNKDFWASTGIGIGYMIQGFFMKSLLFFLALFAYNIVPFAIPITWWSFILCFVALDFFRYYAHRVSHEVNFLWATHVTHHNSEKYNFSTSFRLSWTQQIKIFFFLPVSLMGFHPVVFFICHQIAVLYQFWIHTELIHKMPAWFEFIFVTPSHHRVHHAKDEKYLDKNYGSTMIIWDRMFGTFMPEEERPNYGITTPVKSYNPVKLVFHVWNDIFKALKNSSSWKERFHILFSSPTEFGKYKKQSD